MAIAARNSAADLGAYLAPLPEIDDYGTPVRVTAKLCLRPSSDLPGIIPDPLSSLGTSVRDRSLISKCRMETMHKIMDAYRFMRSLEAGHNRTLNPPPPAHTTFLNPDAKTSWKTGLYIVDDDDLSHLPDYPETLIDVEEPLATVLPPASTRAHSRGRIVDPRSWRAVSFASTLEYCAGLVLASTKKITYFQEQPDALPYRWDGVDRTHRPDFKVKLNNSNRFVYIDVRPSWLLKDLPTQVALINNGVLSDTGDENIILTEHELPWAVRWNAKSMLRGLRAYNRNDCDRLADRLFDLPDEIQIASLIEGLPNATAWNAVWCLIFEEILKPVSPKSMLIDAPKVHVNRGMLRELYP